MTEKPTTTQKFPQEYQIIFNGLDERSDLDQIDLIESQEISELRRIVVELTGPDIRFATASDAAGIGESQISLRLHL